MKISAIYCVRNEIEFLPLSVATILADVDEVVILDNRSTDGTIEYALRLQAEHPEKVKLIKGTTIFDEVSESVTRDESVKHATGDWLLILDADLLMSDGWRADVEQCLNSAGCDGVRVRFEHLVGSQEYIHQGFYEKQHDPTLHPNVPLWQAVLFRRRSNLMCHSAADTCPQFRKEHHARFDEDVPHGRMWDRPGATAFHYGFAKRDMMKMSVYRIHRGDYGHDPEKKQQMMWELVESDNPFRFVGNVHRVDYGPSFVPSVMRAGFATTYRLDLDSQGFIQKRWSMKTGEMC